MPINDTRQNLNGRLRRTAPLVALLLTVSLAISLQPCCELFASLLAPHDAAAGAIAAGDGHARDVTAPPGKLGDACGDVAGHDADLAKVVPAIPVKSTTSPIGAALPADIPREFSAVMHLLRTAPGFHPSPPPFRVYLRFLHLLM